MSKHEVSLNKVKSATHIVHRNIVFRKYFFSIIYSLLSLVHLTFADKVGDEHTEKTTVCVAHTHHSLVKIQSLSVKATVFITCHHVLISLLRIEVVAGIGMERCYTVYKTLLYEVLTKIHIVLLSHCKGDVKRTYPIAVCKHFQQHQVTFVKS